MTGKVDEVKGRLEEAAGALADNSKLKRDGKIDQTVGKAKQAVEKLIDKAKEASAGGNCSSCDSQPEQP